MKAKRTNELLVSSILVIVFSFLFSFKNIGAHILVVSRNDRILFNAMGTIVVVYCLVIFVSIILNFIAFFINKRWLALTSGILYSIAIALIIVVLFIYLNISTALINFRVAVRIIAHVAFLIPTIVLTFVGYVKINFKK